MASKRRLRRNACQGKIRHASMNDAYAHRQSMSKSPNATKEKINVYKCKFCKGWHIGRSNSI